ncbi:hypothetical protein [Peribacillus simplex]|uniref:Uncharacterized protein n=1 Tax=Peribacillus simplex TaxID=1478 RepID=A0AAW7IB04_9BACI|nr:hypothetical protein [Peribacillus simplex]MDM5451649.1 hypothetical protein [Peribacillus simplex]
MELGWMACVAVKVYGVGGANTSAKEVKLLYRKTIRILFGRAAILLGRVLENVRYFLG